VRLLVSESAHHRSARVQGGWRASSGEDH